jgi:hypothetical protein
MKALCKLGIHSWNFCLCKRCGKRRRGPHNFVSCKCTACDRERHDWRGNTCPVCGKTKAYGLSTSDPILCGGGPAGERAYLERVRCPSGSRVDYTSRRRASCLTEDTSFLDEPGVRFAPGGAFAAAAPDSYKDRVPLDIYTLICACGSHSVELFLDCYHSGVSKPPAIEGWTLE